MAVVATKRSIMTLYSDALNICSHQVRIVLAEKGVNVDIIDVRSDTATEYLVDINPYNSLPTLLDRDLVLYDAKIIMEYIDERFPHPPLLPVYPVARARSRLMMYRIQQDWCSLIDRIETGNDSTAVKELTEHLYSIAPLFEQSNFFCCEDFSLLDCFIMPLLWRLPHYGIELSKQHAKPILDYCERMFDRDSFQVSLSDAERELREPLYV